MSKKRKVSVDGEEFEVEMDFDGEKWKVSVGGKTFHIVSEELSIPAPRARKKSTTKSSNSGVVSSAIPGKIVSILVSEGERVSEGDVVLVLEAMKMQNEIKSPIEGIVGRVSFSPGDRVEANVAILEIMSPSEEVV